MSIPDRLGDLLTEALTTWASRARCSARHPIDTDAVCRRPIGHAGTHAVDEHTGWIDEDGAA